MPTTAFAPSSCACRSASSNASARVFSHSSVSSVMLPPTIVWSDAPIVPSTDRDRTVTPRTTPSVFSVRHPSIANAVVVRAWSIGCGIRTCGSWSFRACEVRDDVVMETHEAIELALDNPLLIAVRAESFRPVLDVERRPDAVALDPFRPQVRHVGRAGAHRGKGHRLVIFLHRRLDDLESLEVEARAAGAGTDVALGPPYFDRRIVDDFLQGREEVLGILARMHAHVERGFHLRRDHVDPVSGLNDRWRD